MNPFKDYRITSRYGQRPDPFGSSKTEFHKGIDLVIKHKAPILAFVAGEVVHAKLGGGGSGFGGYGITVAVRDEHNAIHVYAHLDSASVTVGQKISQNDEVGKQGTTGMSTGSHLHYEVRTKGSGASYGYGSHTDPTQYLVKLIEEEEQMIKELTARVEKLENDAEKKVAPDWFVNEFGSADLGGVIKEPKGIEEFWRGQAVIIRLAKAGKLV